MIFSASAFSLDLSSPVNFLVRWKELEVFADTPVGQPFRLFSREHSEGTTEMWGFGLHILVCRKRHGAAFSA